MVTFSSNNTLQKKPKRTKAERKQDRIDKKAKKGKVTKKSSTLGTGQLTSTYQGKRTTGKPAKVKPSKPNYKNPPKGGNWKDLSRKDRIKYTVRGNGKNSGLWDDIPAKKEETKVLTNNQINNSSTLNIDENPSIYPNFQEIQKVIEEEENIEKNTKIEEEINKVADEEGFIPSDVVISTGDDELDEVIAEKRNPIIPGTEGQPQLVQDIEAASLIEDVKNSQENDSYVPLETIEESVEQPLIESLKATAAQEVKYVQGDDGNVVPETGTVVGIKFTGETQETEDILTYEFDYNAPTPEFGDEEASFVKIPSVKQQKTIIGSKDELVIGFSDGSTKLVPIKGGLTQIPEIEITSGPKLENITEEQKELFIKSKATAFEDDIFTPTPDAFYANEVDFENNENFLVPGQNATCEDSQRILESAVNNMSDDIKDINFWEENFNDSEFKYYGFYFNKKTGVLYADVKFDLNGNPVTSDQGRYQDNTSFMTGKIEGAEGNYAKSYIFVRNLSDSPNSIRDLKDWMIENANCYNVKDTLMQPFDNPEMQIGTDANNDHIYKGDPLEDLDDKVSEVQFLIEQIKAIDAEILDNQSGSKTADNINKVSTIKNTADTLFRGLSRNMDSLLKTIDKDKQAFEKGGSKDKRLSKKINENVDDFYKLQDRYNKSVEDYYNKPFSEYKLEYTRSNKNPEVITSTIASSNTSEIELWFGENLTNEGEEALIVKEDNDNKSLDQIYKDNLEKQIDLILENSDLEDKKDYAIALYDQAVFDIGNIQKAVIEAQKLKAKAVENKKKTAADYTAWTFNRVYSRLASIIPGLVELSLMLKETTLRIQLEVAKGVLGDDSKIAALIETEADLTAQITDYIATKTDELIEATKIKPGLEREDYDEVALSIDQTTSGQVVGFLIDITIDIAGTKGLGRVGRLSKAAKLVKWGNKRNKSIITAVKKRKISRKRAAQLLVTENFPTTLLPVLQERTASYVEMIEQWEKDNGQKIPLDDEDRLILTLGVSVVESTLDRIGFEFIGTKKAVMPKLTTYVVNRFIKTKVPGESFKEGTLRILKQMTAEDLLKSSGGIVFNVADEVIQEQLVMLIENAKDGKVKEVGPALYNNPEFGSDEYKKRLLDVAKVTVIGLGILETSGNAASIYRRRVNRTKNYKITLDLFNKIAHLKDKNTIDNYRNLAQTELSKELKDIEESNISKIEKEKRKRKAIEKWNNSLKYVEVCHKILQKVDLDLNIDDASTYFMLETEKAKITEELKEDLPENIKKEKEDRLAEIDEELKALTSKVMEVDPEDSEKVIVKESSKGKGAKEFDKEITSIIEKVGDQAEVIVVETQAEAEQKAQELGGSMKGNPAQFFTNKDGKYIIINKSKALVKIGADKIRFIASHELDHFMVDLIEEETGSKEITFALANEVFNQYEANNLEFTDEKAKNDFDRIIKRYREFYSKKKDSNLALADEVIVNFRQFLKEKKVKVKKSIKDRIANAITNAFKRSTKGKIEIDISKPGELENILGEWTVDTKVSVGGKEIDVKGKSEEEKFAEDEVVKQAKDVLEGLMSKAEYEKLKAEMAFEETDKEPVVNSKERFSLEDDIKERDELNKEIIRLNKLNREESTSAKEAKENTKKINKSKDRTKILNKGIINARNVAIIENPNSKLSEKQKAENALIADNRDALVQDVINKKVDPSKGIPLSYIREKLEDEFTNLYVTYFNRAEEYKNSPIGFHIQSNLIKRLPKIFDDYNKNKNVDIDKISPGSSEIVTTQEEVFTEDEQAKIDEQNMRKALGILPDSPLYDSVLEKVKIIFGTKLPTVKSGKLRKKLKDLFAIELEAEVKKLIKEMGMDKFLETYGEEIYYNIDQETMNKSFPEFTRKGKRLTVPETRKAIEDGLIPIKIDEQVADGVYIFEKVAYNKERFKEYHLEPKKGTKYSKENGLAKVIAKMLGKDATMEVLQDSEVVSKMNEINQLYNQLEVTAEEIGAVLAKDPKSRFKLLDNNGKLISDPDYVQHIIVQAGYKAFRNGGDKEAWEEASKVLPKDVLKLAQDAGIPELFNAEATRYKQRLKKKLADKEIPESLIPFVDTYFSKITKKSDIEGAMKELDDFAQNITDILPGDLLEVLGSRFWGYDYTYLDGGEKGGKGSGVFGPFKKSKDKVEKKVKNKKDKDIDFEPTKVEKLNSGTGILGRVETILNKNISKKKKEKLLGLNEDGSIEPDSLLAKLQEANQNNVKALNYVLVKAAKHLAENPDDIPGFLRWQEHTTNNVQAQRALTSLLAIQINNNSQAPFSNEDGTKFSSTKKPGFVINTKHPDYDRALAFTKDKVKREDFDSEEEYVNKFDKMLAKHIGYKGEHVDPAAKVMADLSFNVLEAVDKLMKENITEDEKKAILESLKAKNDILLSKYTQVEGTEIASAEADDKGGTTSAAENIRLEGFETDNMLVVNDPSKPIDEVIKESVIAKDDVIKAIEAETETKPTNVDELNDSGVIEVDLEGDLTNQEVLSKMMSLDKTKEKSREKKPRKRKKARVFDFDDTVARTKSKVFYTLPDGTKGILTAEEFAKEGDKIAEQGGKFDFSDFNKVIDGEEGPLFDLIKKMSETEGDRDIFILTARASEAQKQIFKWLKSKGVNIKEKNVIGLGNSSPYAKSEFFIKLYIEDDYNDFYFADDHFKNVEAVQDVLSVVDVNSKVQQAKVRFVLEGEEIANKLIKMISETKGVSEDELVNISQVKATIKSKKIKDPFFQSSSTQNFTGLLYKFIGKGEKGNKDWKLLNDNLVKPYTRALNDLARIKNTMMADFNALLGNYVGKGKAIENLNAEVPGLGGYTYEDAIRVLAWSKQDISVDGIPNTTLNKIKELGKKNQAVNRMADQLIALGKGDGYYYPGENWLVGSLTTDTQQLISNVKRPKVLKEWNENIEIIFGKDNGTHFTGQNMIAINRVYGPKFREALEDMLRRMKSGRNRRKGNSRVENRFFDWLNNSVGAVMFFNMRSGLLQTLSAANYINWSFNNPAKAAAAFGNQPQFWKDFMDLFNSDFLVDRRGGNKINISENEIFDLQNTKGNKAKEFLNLIIRKGFSITQVADSFAIASGGATYYRNRIEDLLKKNPNMSKSDAEAQAYEEWTALSREAQQSSDAMEVSSQQAGSLGRIILAFGNTPMQYNRIIWKSIQDIKNGRGDLKTNLSRISYYGALQNLMFNALQQALFAGLGDDEEKWDERKYDLIDGMLNSLMRGMGISGSIIAAIKDVGIDVYDRSKKPRPEYYKAVFEALNVAPPLDVKVSKFVRGMNTYEYNRKSPEMEDFTSLDNPTYMSAALIIASATNVPVDRLLQKMTNIRDAFQQDQENWKRVMLLMGWSEWQLENQAEGEAREKEESDLKHYHRALENPSLYNKNEQLDILRQHGYSEKEIDGMKKQEDRVSAILKAEKESGEKYTSKIPNVKVEEKQNSTEASAEVNEQIKSDIFNQTTGLETKDDTSVDDTPLMLQDAGVQQMEKPKEIVKPKKVNFTENKSFKNHRVPVGQRNETEVKLYNMSTPEQVDTLKSLGMTSKEIKALKYEGDRVRKIIELQKK